MVNRFLREIWDVSPKGLKKIMKKAKCNIARPAPHCLFFSHAPFFHQLEPEQSLQIYKEARKQ